MSRQVDPRSFPPVNLCGGLGPFGTEVSSSLGSRDFERFNRVRGPEQRSALLGRASLEQEALGESPSRMGRERPCIFLFIDAICSISGLRLLSFFPIGAHQNECSPIPPGCRPGLGWFYGLNISFSFLVRDSQLPEHKIPGCTRSSISYSSRRNTRDLLPLFSYCGESPNLRVSRSSSPGPFKAPEKSSLRLPFSS